MNRFDKNGFMEFIQETFVGFDGFDGMIPRQILGNIIDFAIENKNSSRDQLVYFLSDIFPDDLDFGEIAMFTPDEFLTKSMLEAKHQSMKDHGIQIQPSRKGRDER